MTLVPSKTSGKAPILQTRLDYYNSELEKKKAHDAEQAKLPRSKRREYSMPEIVKEDTITHKDPQGRPLLALPADYNHTDVRLVDPEDFANSTPWVVGADKDELELEWNHSNAES